MFQSQPRLSIKSIHFLHWRPHLQFCEKSFAWTYKAWKIIGLLMFSEIGKLRERKRFLYFGLGVWSNISKHTCLDILRLMFGYVIARVWIFSLPGIKEHPCDPNEATQLVNYLMHFERVWERKFRVLHLRVTLCHLNGISSKILHGDLGCSDCNQKTKPV